MKIIDCIQGEPAWHAARAGRVTASRIADLMARTKTGFGASRANYMAELIAERLTGTVAESYTNAAMQCGTEKEPDAIAAYEFFNDCACEAVGFVLHPSIENAGCSPDRLVGKDGLVEAKCPTMATHLDTLLTGVIADKYIKQMQFQMAVCERAWCDYISFDPRLPTRMQLFVQRVPRDDKFIAEIESEARAFLKELDAKVAALTAKYGEALAA